MSKSFFETFPSLELDKRVMRQFETVIVDRVVVNRDRSLVRVYITSDHVIPKESVYHVEKAIRKTLYSKGNAGEVRIYETFHLSEAYTPEALLDEYKNSILLELDKYGVGEKLLFEKSEISFLTKDEMHLTVTDSGFLEEKKDELKRILEKIFIERCGLPVKVGFTFKLPEKRPEETEYDYYFERLDEAELRQEEEAAAPKEEKQTLGLTPRKKKSKGKDPEPSRNPDVLYGRDFTAEEYMPISEILGDLPEVTVRGQIIKAEEITLRDGERKMLLCDLTDFTDSIRFKVFVRNEEAPDLSKKLKEGSFISLRGPVLFDTFDKELSISHVKGIKTIPDFRVFRSDNAPVKRVELHCHTKMSEMDGLSEVSDIVKRACKWGHPAIAVTDHGVVSAFPDANHAWEDLFKEYRKKCEEEGIKADKHKFFKILYGTEGYLTDDDIDIVSFARKEDRALNFGGEFVVFDIETTGFSPVKNRIIEIGAVKVLGGKITDRFSVFVNPGVPIPYEIVQLTGITDAMVSDAKPVEEILPEFVSFIGDAVPVAHNASFDMSFILENCKRLGIDKEFTYADTMQIARILLPDMKKHTLDAISKRLKIELLSHHRAVDDAEATAHMFLRFLGMLGERNIRDLGELNDLVEKEKESLVKHLFLYHVILIAKNNVGRENLYRIISESHMRYFHGKPRIPKSLIRKYREGILVGSACERGELYRALLDGAPEEKIANIVRFYDYLEIQPLANNRFMIASEHVRSVHSEEDIIDFNKKIVELGEEWGKPVVATCDVHFLDPEDEIYRKIILAGKNMDEDNDLPLYLRTTEEMLEEFSYLGEKKAREIVIDNTRKIADMVDVISPVRPDKCPPVIPDSDETLRRICYDRAHELYGEELPDIVTERLEKELHSIISNGFAVMYIIAQKLVWKSVEDGYLVGSRGSVGSSLVAFMAGITEVNSLAAHYRCPKCHYVDFDSEVIRQNVGNAGCDLPDRDCPVCGEPLVKDGFDIPFETFLGFKGDKEPDIDLNFSGEYQAKAHKYTEVIFGAGQTYRAGTILKLQDKTAYGYVKHYFEDKGLPKRSAEIERITRGCTGVRNTTGQHPGGIIVLPVGEDINTFTPIQHPPKDDVTAATHFDYHSIDHNLLKLDILGHDDPTMIRMLQDLTGVEPTGIPLDDPKVMTLFQNTSALGITPSQIGGVETGSLGIPEFGTDFVIKMLLTTKPKTLSDLIRISGLGHGTDVWLGNAEKLIEDGTADLAHCICCRDDIMIYLISKGLDPSLSFSIMEMVRKGNVAKGKVAQWGEWKEEMRSHGVPDWYIWSCEKIKYMFPKAHAAAYVMMAWRIGWFKINYPLAYYTAYFSIRSKGFDYATMCCGYSMMCGRMEEIRKMEHPSPKEENMLKDMRIVQEMYERGYEFMPIDLKLVHARNFRIIDGKIMPALMTIDGIAEAAADAIVEAVKDGPFLSKDDFRDRTKVSKTIADTMAGLGLLGDIPESNQISLFDIM